MWCIVFWNHLFFNLPRLIGIPCLRLFWAVTTQFTTIMSVLKPFCWDEETQTWNASASTTGQDGFARGVRTVPGSTQLSVKVSESCWWYCNESPCQCFTYPMYSITTFIKKKVYFNDTFKLKNTIIELQDGLTFFVVVWQSLTLWLLTQCFLTLLRFQHIFPSVLSYWSI